MKDPVLTPPAIICEQQVEFKSWKSIVRERNLDVSIVEVKDLNEEYRVDSEFYRPYQIKNIKEIEKHDYSSIDDIAFVTDGILQSIQFNSNSNILLFSAKAPKENYFDISGLKTISKDQHVKNPRTALKENDIIISTVGIIGNCAVITPDLLPANSDRHVGIIRDSKIPPFFISTFLLSKFGQLQIQRNIKGNVQPNLYISDIKNLKIPIPKKEFQTKIAELVQKAHAEREKSKTLYAEAEQILLDELELTNWQPTDKNTAIKSSEEANLYGRADAEFFQPKYDELFEKLEKFEVKKLDEIVDYQKGVEPGSNAYSENGIPFVRVSDVSIKGIKRIEKRVSKELAKSFEGKYSPKKGKYYLQKMEQLEFHL